MQYDFDEIIDRRGTGALKYEALLPRWAVFFCTFTMKKLKIFKN